MSFLPSRLYLGTSGWTSRSWSAGRFYPPGLPQSQWLEWYATRFNTVEINTTFYRIPSAAMMTRWHELVPPEFRFAVKVWRAITHDKRLRNTGEELRQFFEACRPMGKKLAVLLVQLPPGLAPDRTLLDEFLAEAAALNSPAGPRIAVEFRHPGWIADDVLETLDSHCAARVISDIPQCRVDAPGAAPFVYIRRHGPAGDYRGSYAEDEIARDAAWLRPVLTEGRDVFFYYNNTIEPDAAVNAQSLRAALAAGG